MYLPCEHDNMSHACCRLLSDLRCDNNFTKFLTNHNNKYEILYYLLQLGALGMYFLFSLFHWNIVSNTKSKYYIKGFPKTSSQVHASGDGITYDVTENCVYSAVIIEDYLLNILAFI